jgi:protein-disulfide isomerase
VFAVYRNFPLSGHANAIPAAKSARCAGLQKPAWFWEMHDWLYANLGRWSSASDAAVQFRTEALSLGVEPVEYDKCLADPATEKAILDDQNEGIANGVTGTPAFVLSRLDTSGKVVDSRPLSGALPYDSFAQIIDELLAAK